ncbi:MAG: phosphoribosylglycinamide synthetase C domain-containing protein, partial [Candidatus Subteraquimicrobiales bacterium]|nr:phosphoribosylglycinamide synthetase C domain-containing protein [Candidatus Subteraquimicrobiales bacterium]
KISDFKDVLVFHSGTKQYLGKYFTNGGRVLGITALGSDIRRTINKVYLAIEEISFEGMHYRRDIAEKALDRF